jgi:hypothetical protein
MATRSKDEILDAIRRAAQDLGKRPSRSEFAACSRISVNQVYNWFPSWNSAVEAAGLNPDTSHSRIENSVLLEDWGRVVRELRQIPTLYQYGQRGRYHAKTFPKRFGAWSNMPDVFRQFAADKEQWSDAVALLPVANVPNPPSSELRDSVADRYADRNDKPCTKPVHSKLADRPVYGNHIDFRGLRHEPVNENGVILVFGIVARELGYSVESVQAGFPDCEAKRLIGPDKWQRVTIEFEYESRNFRDHGHPVDGCDIIVCWRHNWPECPDQIEVVELSSVIKQLAKSDE